MKEAAPTRPYRQGRRAEAAEARTEAIREAALDAFMAKPFDQITLAEVAERAGVGCRRWSAASRPRTVWSRW